MTVSFETAKELKEAGFPQPSDAHYDTNRWMMFYVEPDEEGRCGPYSLDKIEDIRAFGDPCEVTAYAPTATDLLPHNWMLVRHGSQWECIEENELDNFFSNGLAPQNLFTHDNPAEAAAAAWLFVNRKTISK